MRFFKKLAHVQAALPASLHDGHGKNWVHSACRHVEPVSLAHCKCGFKHFPWFLDPGMVFCNSNYHPAQQCSLRASPWSLSCWPLSGFLCDDGSGGITQAMESLEGPGRGGQWADMTQLQADGICPKSTWETRGCVRAFAESRQAKGRWWVVWKAAGRLGLQRSHVTANTPQPCSVALLVMPVQKCEVRLVPVPCSGEVSCRGQPPRRDHVPRRLSQLWHPLHTHGSLQLQVALTELWKHEDVVSGSLFETMVISRDVACGDFSIIGKSCSLPVLHFKCKHMPTTPSHMSERFLARQGTEGRFLSL